MEDSWSCPFCYSVIRACLRGQVPVLKHSRLSQQDVIQAQNVIFCQVCQLVMRKLSELIINNATEVCHLLVWGRGGVLLQSEGARSHLLQMLTPVPRREVSRGGL